MTPKKITALAALGLFALMSAAVVPTFSQAVTVDASIASMSNDQLIAARKAAMKENERTLQKAESLIGDEAVAAATTLLQNFTNLPHLFKEGSGEGRTSAKPEIWANWADFKGRFDADAASAAAMLKGAQDGDDDAYFAAIQEISNSCNSCHRKYKGF
jgi:cytochrome c556